MKKKKFITPKVRVIKLDAQELLAGSDKPKASVNTATVIVNDFSNPGDDPEKAW